MVGDNLMTKLVLAGAGGRGQLRACFWRRLCLERRLSSTVTSCKEREYLDLFCPRAVKARGRSMGVPAYCLTVSFGRKEIGELREVKEIGGGRAKNRVGGLLKYISRPMMEPLQPGVG